MAKMTKAIDVAVPAERIFGPLNDPKAVHPGRDISGPPAGHPDDAPLPRRRSHRRDAQGGPGAVLRTRPVTTSAGMRGIEKLHGRLALLTATTFLLLMLNTSGVAYALSFQPAQALGLGLDPSIAVDGQHVYVVWRSFHGAVCYPSGACYNDVFFTQSTDGGASFSGTPIDVSHDVYSSDFPVVASSGSNVYAAWESQDVCCYQQVYFSRSTDGGLTFSAAVNLSNPIGYPQNLIVAAAGSYVYLVWQDNTPGTYQVFYRFSTNYGASFGPTINLSNTPGNSGDITVSLTATSIYVAWTSGGVTLNGVLVRRSTDGGVTFGATYIIAAQVGSRVLFASDSNVYAVWPQQVPRHKKIPPHVDVFFSGSADGGNAFGPAINLSNGAVDSYRPRISVSGSGSIDVAWLEATSSSVYSLFSTQSSNGGLTFGSPVKVSSAVNWAFSQDNGWYGQQYLAVSGGSVYLVWFEEPCYPCSTDEVFLSRGS